MRMKYNSEIQNMCSFASMPAIYQRGFIFIYRAGITTHFTFRRENLPKLRAYKTTHNKDEDRIAAFWQYHIHTEQKSA
jgi:hypothetical protein